MVRHVPTNQAEPSHTELLQQIVGAQRATVHLLTELVALSRGQNGVLPGDEADRLIGEYMNPLNSFVEIIN